MTTIHARTVLWSILPGLVLIALPIGSSAEDQSLEDQQLPKQIQSMKLVQRNEAQTNTSQSKRQPVQKVWTPPLGRGTPDRRGGLATRGLTATLLPAIFVLAPNHTDLTLQEQPTLYWFASTEVTYPVELTFIDQEGIKPAFEALLAPPMRPGIHPIRLKDHGIRLETGKHYSWSVALVLDDKRRSKDILGIGTIRRMDRDQVIIQPKHAKEDHIARLVKAGLWYDAVMDISEQIEATPADRDLRRKRAALLDEVKLSDVASYDRNSGK